jgi:hypothetical protein
MRISIFRKARHALWSRYRLMQELQGTEKQNYALMAETHQYSLMWDQFEDVQDDLMGEVRKLRQQLAAQRILLQALGQIEESRHESAAKHD